MSGKPCLPGCIVAGQQFLFPDSGLDKMPEELSLFSARNTKTGLQLLFSCQEPFGKVSLEGEGFQIEYYQMKEVPVEYNTGSVVDQGGDMVVSPQECPDYAVRLAPFWVHDCLKPLPDGKIPSEKGRAAMYLCIGPEKETKAGLYELTLRILADGAEHVCRIHFQVYPAAYEENRFNMTNWFGLGAIEKVHGVKKGTAEFYQVLREYARAMRRMHQDTFAVFLDAGDELEKQLPCEHFSFEHIKPIIQLFFEEGFQNLETGGLLTRGSRPDGSPDMFTDDLKCSFAPTVSADSEEGFLLLNSLMEDFSAFLEENGWHKKVLFHVMDEPDVHYGDDKTLQARRKQYFMTANIVRKHLPGAKILDAVQTAQFRGAIDIMVPITYSYQKGKEIFDQITAAKDQVWTYVCCGPQGFWLNRFLDQPLANGRLLFWGCAKNRIPGFLHWGFNQFEGIPDIFKGTSCQNNTGLGTSFPCGDAFIVYPGEKGPWISMRLEAARKGAEDAAFLKVLLEKDPQAHDRLIGKVFTSFDCYNNDPQLLEDVSRELLELLA